MYVLYRDNLHGHTIYIIYINKFDHNTVIILYNHAHSNYLWVFLQPNMKLPKSRQYVVCCSKNTIFPYPTLLCYDRWLKTCQVFTVTIKPHFVFECRTTCFIVTQRTYFYKLCQELGIQRYKLHVWVSLSLEYFSPHPYSSSKTLIFGSKIAFLWHLYIIKSILLLV